MAKIDLTKYGITGTPEIIYNPSYDDLYNKDKFFVMDETSKDTVWWTSDAYKNDNKPVTKETWKVLKDLASKELSGKKLYVMDTFCGANENTRQKIRFIMEVRKEHVHPPHGRGTCQLRRA